MAGSTMTKNCPEYSPISPAAAQRIVQVVFKWRFFASAPLHALLYSASGFRLSI
jgi:hypothetical protein